VQLLKKDSAIQNHSVQFKHPLFVLQWCGVIVLCLYGLSAALPTDLERQANSIILTGGNTRSVYPDVIGGKEQRNGMTILQAVGQGNVLHAYILRA
jgi:hypothetical protein